MATTPLAAGGLIGGLVIRQPVGVVACISPYNFPLVNMAGKLGPALATGNTIVMKPAPQDPLAIIELARDVRRSRDSRPASINLVTGSAPEVGQALVDSTERRHDLLHRLDHRRASRSSRRAARR